MKWKERQRVHWRSRTPVRQLVRSLAANCRLNSSAIRQVRGRFLPAFALIFLFVRHAVPAEAQSAAAARSHPHSKPAAARAPAELRGLWVDAFGEGIKSPAQIDSLIKRAHIGHLNALFAQVRKSGDAYYLSRYEPWASDNSVHFNALAYLIQRAHAAVPKLQVHAWINCCAVGKTHGNPLHIALLHPEWLSISNKGETYDHEATKIDPGNPDAAEFTARVYLDVARHYRVDGIHFDFVRYGGAEWGYNSASVERFNLKFRRTGIPDPVDPLWKQWRRDQVTELVRKVYALVYHVNPHVALSAATVTWKAGPLTRSDYNTQGAPMNRVFQDWESWMKEGILDWNCSMAYYSQQRHPNWFSAWVNWVRVTQATRFAAPGIGAWLNSIHDSLWQIDVARGSGAAKAHGIMIYSYSGTESGPKGTDVAHDDQFFWALSHKSAYSKHPPFATSAPVPPMPWRQNPRFGLLCGYLLNPATLAPIDGGRVSVDSGSISRVVPTDGTGFWAATTVPAGTSRLVPLVARLTPHRATVQVRRGISAVQVLFAGDVGCNVITDLQKVYTLPVGTNVLASSVTVLVGTDTLPGHLVVGDRAGCAVIVNAKMPQQTCYQPGDLVCMRGTITLEGGERKLTADAARWVGCSAEQNVRWLRETPAAVAARGRKGGPFIELKGIAGRVVASRLAITVGSSVVWVPLTARKLPGVEAKPVDIPAPPPGCVVKVRGILTVTRSGKQVTAVVTPIGFSAVEVVAQ